MENQDTTATNYDEWLAVKLLAQVEKSFTEPAIRNAVFNAADRKTSKGIIPGNGLAPHIRRLGTKVLIHHGGFRGWYSRGAK